MATIAAPANAPTERTCAVCGIRPTYRGFRCRECHNALERERYRNQRPSQPVAVCVDCKREPRKPGSERCTACSAAHRIARRRGTRLSQDARRPDDTRPPVRLRVELARDRRLGLPFDDVYAEDCTLVVTDLPDGEQAAWLEIFAGQRSQWRSAYYDEASALRNFTFDMTADDDERDANLLIA